MAGIILEINVDDKGTAKVKQFSDETKKAFEEMKKGSEQTKGALDSFRDSWMGVTAKIGIAVAAFYTAKRMIYDTAFQIASATNEIERQAAVLGISTDEFQKWQYAAKMADVNSQELAIGMKMLSRNMEDAAQGSGDVAKYFSIMGISVKTTEGHLRPLNDMMGDIMDKFASWESGPRKIAIAMQLFGRSGETLIPLLNKGRAGFQELAAEAQKMGIILSPELVKKGSEAEEIFKKIEARLKATKESFAPAALESAKAADSILNDFNRLNDWLRANKTTDWFPQLKEINVWIKANPLDKWLHSLGITMPAYRKKLDEAEMLRESAEYFRNIEIGKVKPPGIAYDSTIAEERIQYEKEFWEEMYKRWEIENKILAIEGDMADQLANDMFPSLEQVTQIVEQGNQYWEVQNKKLAETQNLIEEIDWESVASGMRELSSDTERTINQTRLFLDKEMDALNKLKDIFKTFGEDISSVWATNMSRMITDSQNMKETLTNIWKGMADVFVSAIMKMITNWILFGQVTGSTSWGGTTGILGWIGSIFKTTPIVTAQHGLEYVPHTGLYQLHQGKKVISAERNRENNVIVNVINQAPNTKTEARESQDGRGNRSIEIIISELVAKEIYRTGSPPNTAIREMGGSNRLIRR